MTDWRWEPYFHPWEFACNHCWEIHVDPAFMDNLKEMRIAYDKPMLISSGYRCPEYNAKISSTGLDGPHTLGAADTAVFGGNALKIVELALYFGFTGIGISQRGPQLSRLIHLDMLDKTAKRPRPWIWSY